MAKLLHIFMFVCADSWLCFSTGKSSVLKLGFNLTKLIGVMLRLELRIPIFNVKILLSHSFMALPHIK